jgi:hypothetical protein
MTLFLAASFSCRSRQKSYDSRARLQRPSCRFRRSCLNWSFPQPTRRRHNFGACLQSKPKTHSARCHEPPPIQGRITHLEFQYGPKGMRVIVRPAKGQSCGIHESGSRAFIDLISRHQPVMHSAYFGFSAMTKTQSVTTQGFPLRCQDHILDGEVKPFAFPKRDITSKTWTPRTPRPSSAYERTAIRKVNLISFSSERPRFRQRSSRGGKNPSRVSAALR